jgi:hypothetical protein
MQRTLLYPIGKIEFLEFSRGGTTMIIQLSINALLLIIILAALLGMLALSLLAAGIMGWKG